MPDHTNPLARMTPYDLGAGGHCGAYVYGIDGNVVRAHKLRESQMKLLSIPLQAIGEASQLL